jgi:hypothetical protein
LGFTVFYPTYKKDLSVNQLNITAKRRSKTSQQRILLENINEYWTDQDESWINQKDEQD